MEYINTFSGGLDLDTDKKFVSNDKYIDATDITLTADGEYQNPVPIKGSLSLLNLGLDSGYPLAPGDYAAGDLGLYFNILGSASVNINWDGEIVNGIALFVSRPVTLDYEEGNNIIAGTLDNFEIYFCKIDYTQNGSVVKIYEKNSTDTSSPYRVASVDYEVVNEYGLDIVYLTNQVDTPMRVVCQYNTGDSELQEEQVSLVRVHNASPPGPVVQDGGSLLCGSYSFVCRMVNTSLDVYSQWSLASDPRIVALYEEAFESSTEYHSAPVGAVSNNKIVLSLSFNSESAEFFDSFQVGVIKNVSGTGVPATTVSLLSIKSKGTSTSAFETYYGNEEELEIDSSDIFIDDAQIKSFNTLSIKNNFLIGGGVTYSDLSYDNGDVTVGNTSGFSTTERNISSGVPLDVLDTNTGSLFSSQFHWRDELYRYAISYHDNYGSWSEPQVLDFSSATSNSASAGIIDYKMPSLFDEPLCGDESLGTRHYKSLSMEIDDITNHPSWAKGFVILRAKRIKDIQFQTPVYPTMAVEPLTAMTWDGDSNSTIYPQDPEGTTDYSSAQPPESVLGTIFPKNLKQVVSTSIQRGDQRCQYYYGYESSISGQQPVDAFTRDATYSTNGLSEACQYIHCIFPPNNLFGYINNHYNPYVYKNNDYLDIVDIQQNSLSNLDSLSESSESSDPFVWETYKSLSGSYGSLVIEDNYTNYGKENELLTNKSFIPIDPKVTEYHEVAYGADKVVMTTNIKGLKGSSYGDNSGLVAEGLNEGGAVPINQKLGLIALNKALVDINYKNMNNTRLDYDGDTATTGLFNTDLFSSFTNHVDESIVANDPDEIYLNRNIIQSDSVGITVANVRRNLSDNRYGGAKDNHEFIFTGKYRELSSAEVSGNTPIDISDIRGGDCSYSMFKFKPNENTYGIPEVFPTGSYPQYSSSDIEDQWGNSFSVDDGSTYTFEAGRPVPYSADHQHFEVFLESEIKGLFLDRTDNFYDVPKSVGDLRVPFSYSYNPDLSIPNYNKIWSITPSNIKTSVNEYKTRLQYSDINISNTSENGFSRFRVGNIYDMDGSRGSITKLVNSDDRLYCVQQRGVSYIPVLGNVIESADGVSLAIRSAEVIGIPSYISTKIGSSYIRTIQNSTQGFYLFDENSRSAFHLLGGQISPVGTGINTFLYDKLEEYSENNIRFLAGAYDLKNKEYILYSENDFTQSYDPWMIIFSEKKQSWVSKISLGSNFSCCNLVSADSNLFFHGFGTGTNARQELVYSSGSETIFGPDNDLMPTIKFLVNNDFDKAKVFDLLKISSSGSLHSLDYRTYNTYDLNQSSSTEFATDVINREGTYLAPSLRDNGTGQRMRGSFLEVTANWYNPASETKTNSSLSAIKTVTRTSSR